MPLHSNSSECAVCGAPIADGERWLFLNRYGVGTGSRRALAEALDDDRDYLWDVDQDREDDFATGKVLHWPTCAGHWIEAMMISVDFEMREKD